MLATCLFTRSAVASPTERYWILQGPGLEAQAMATDPRAVRFFSQPGRIVIYPAIARVHAPPSWHVILWRKYDSYQEFASDVLAGRISSGVQIVAYDPEKWGLTPIDEQVDPIGYTIKFAQLAHAHGYKFLATPAINLMNVLRPRTNKFLAFVDFGYARMAARYADFYHIQAQGLQHNVDGPVPSYAWFVRQIAAQVRSVNPNCIVTAGISTNTPGDAAPTTADDIAAAVRAADSDVDGYWLNVLRGDKATALRALEEIDPSITSPR